MIYKKKYVKELIRKQINGVLTPREAGELDACRRLYAHEEIQEMVAEVLLSMEDDELPEIPTGGWKPDFATIIRKAEQCSHNTRPFWNKVGWAAAVLIPIVTVLTYWYVTREQLPDFLHGPCTGLTSDADVPLTESVVSLRWGDTAEMQVAGERHGEILRTSNVRVLKTEEGILQLRELGDGIEPTGTEQGIAVATDAQQQAMVELPDGTRIRLNAQSTLHYAPEKQKSERIRIQGEAYVQRPKKPKVVPLLIHTDHGFVRSIAGNFVLLGLENMTRATALGGKLSLHANSRKDELWLDCYGAMGSVARFVNTQGGQQKDSLLYQELKDPDALLVWTKAVRRYKDVPLREFVAQMSFWYGFQVKDYHCLPADRRITTTVCYRKDQEAVFATIREAGVLLYETKGMISFCPEEAKLPKNVGTMLAWWE